MQYWSHAAVAGFEAGYYRVGRLQLRQWLCRRDEHALDKVRHRCGMGGVQHSHLDRRRLYGANNSTGKGHYDPTKPDGAQQYLAIPAIQEIVPPTPEAFHRSRDIQRSRPAHGERLTTLLWPWLCGNR